MNNQDLKVLSPPIDYTSIGNILDPKLTTKDHEQTQTPIDPTTGKARATNERATETRANRF